MNDDIDDIDNLNITPSNVPEFYKTYVDNYLNNSKEFIDQNFDNLKNFEFDFTRYNWILKKKIVLRTFNVQHGTVKCKISKMDKPFLLNRNMWYNKDYKSIKRQFIQSYILDPFNYLMESIYGECACLYKLDRNTIRHKTNDGLIIQILPKEKHKTERNRDQSKEKFCLLKMKINSKKIWFTLELDSIQ